MDVGGWYGRQQVNESKKNLSGWHRLENHGIYVYIYLVVS